MLEEEANGTYVVDGVGAGSVIDLPEAESDEGHALAAAGEFDGC